MNKFIIIIFSETLIFVMAFVVYVQKNYEKIFTKQKIGTPSTNDVQSELAENYCFSDSDCLVPFGYAVKSNCPYESLCFDGSCVVACPILDGLECDNDYDCDCSLWDKNNDYLCVCHQGKCASLISE